MENFENPIELKDYPKLEELVDVELPGEKKEEMVAKVFKDRMEEIMMFLQIVGLALDSKTEGFWEKLNQLADKGSNEHPKEFADIFLPYFDEKIKKPLFAKYTELLLDTKNKGEIEALNTWYGKVSGESEEIWRKWFNEIISLVDVRLGELVKEIKEKNDGKESEGA